MPVKLTDDDIRSLEDIDQGFSNLHNDYPFVYACLTLLLAERKALQAQITTLEQGMGDILVTLSVPAAEYVPAIPDAFDVIRNVMGEEWWKSQPGYSKSTS